MDSENKTTAKIKLGMRYRYIRRKFSALVILLQMGHNRVERQRNQHSRQQVCQHWVETVGSV